jgi:hypothetical protein
MAFFSYCDFTLSVFFYTPLYFASSYGVNVAIQNALEAASDQVDENFYKFGQ